MRAVVTGGAGFIGSNLVHLLSSERWQVSVLDNFSSGYRANLADLPGITVLDGDIRDASVVERAIQGAEAVFHLAASVGNKRSIERPFDDAEINALGTLRVLEACRRHGVRKLVFSSSAGIFGELKTLPIGEDHPIEPDSPYGASKLYAEKACLAYGRLYGFEAVCLRYFNVYGVHQRYDEYGNVIPIFARQALAGLPITIFGDGEQTRDFVNVRDVAQANRLAAVTPNVTGAFNLGSGTRISIKCLAAMIGEAAGIASEIRYGPERPGDVRHSLADIAKAKRAFGYAPQSELAVGLKTYIEWLRTDPVSGGTGERRSVR
jgi:UDP-glucose 4-epimerase